MNAKIIDSDGRPLPGQIRTDTVNVSPGERYGVMLTSDKVFSDNILVYYLSLNTLQKQGTEKVPVAVNNSSGIDNVSTEKKNNVLIFPNPVNDQLNIKANENITGLRIQDMLGQIVQVFLIQIW